MKLADVMTRDVESCAPDTPLMDVAMKMKELDVGVIPITQGDKLLGVVTDRDLVVKGLADRLPIDAQVSEVMSGELVTGTVYMTAGEAADKMAEAKIRRLPIIEGEDKLIGMVSLGDLSVTDAAADDAGDALSEISTPSQPHH